MSSEILTTETNEKPLSPEQQDAAYFPTRLSEPERSRCKNLVIEAGAGAGKTTLLTRRVDWLLNKAPMPLRMQPHELILVTFSRAADEELRGRVEAQLEKSIANPEALERALGRLHMSTIDALFMQLVGNLFPTWWEDVRGRLPAEKVAQWKLENQRFPPAVNLVTEDELRPELAEDIINIIERHSSTIEHEAHVLDFVLAGAFEPRGFQELAPALVRYRGLDRISAALLHENILKVGAPPLRFALERIHPASIPVLSELQTLARDHFHKRLMTGRLTHNDRMMFLYHLLCLAPEEKNGTFFESNIATHLPLQCRELIVDEYQDTNETQHDILMSLVMSDSKNSENDGRMVVVGDPKQSIYGFRSAHVGVFQRLKTDPSWKLIELTRNFRSHPDLLPFINYLSDMTFSYRNNKIPEDFHQTGFAINAQQTFVAAKALDAGRTDTVTFSFPRLLMLGASTSSDRLENGLEAHELPSLHTFNAWALACELKGLVESGRFSWSDMVVLCETNDWANKTQAVLHGYGIPCLAKVSRTANGESSQLKRCEDVGLILGKWLCGPLELNEFATLLWSGWLDTPANEASALLEAAAAGEFPQDMIITPASDRETKKGETKAPAHFQAVITHLKECRELAAEHFFSAWQLFRWGFPGVGQQQRNLMNAAMENVAFALHQALDVWSIRQSLHIRWPAEFLDTQLAQLRLKNKAENPNQDALTICTIHGAKGLEWPVVVFWPSTQRERAPENFVMKSGETATHIKWLAEDTESASLYPWINNPHPPQDTVAIHVASQSGEQTIRWSADLQDRLEQDFERQRVFYTAFTRAREMLILMSPAVSGRVRKNLRDKLAGLKEGDSFDPAALKISGLETTVFACFADRVFDLRKEAKRGARPKTPWFGRQLEPALKTPEWSGQVAMKDYGPAWLASFEPPLVSADSPGSSAHSASSHAEHVDPQWMRDWLEKQVDKVKTTPWRLSNSDAISVAEPIAAAVEEPVMDKDPQKLSSRKTPEATSEFTASEEGLRFHALMEHADSKKHTGRSFIQRLLNNAVVREHELEIWSTVDATQKSSDTVRGLLKTQRRIVDLFCVVPANKWPKELWQSHCINSQGEQVGILQQLTSQGLRENPNLHLVVDFKTGQPKEEHLEQMGQYLRWVGHVLAHQSELIVNTPSEETLFAGSAKVLVGILCYTSDHLTQTGSISADSLISVDKNTSLLFVSPE